MFKLYSKKVILHTIGVFLIALGMALDDIHGLGHHPMKEFSRVLAFVTNINYWLSFFLICIFFDFVYFIKTKKLEVFFTLIETFILIFLAITLKNTLSIPIYYYVNTTFLRVLLVIISLNITSIGIVILFKSHLSMFAIEQAIVLVRKLIPIKINLSVARTIVDAIFFLLTITLSFIWLPQYGFSSYWATLIIVFLGGLCLHVYFLIYDKIFPKKHINVPISLKHDGKVQEYNQSDNKVN